MLEGKNIILGITGGIAVYKIAELASLLNKNGANVDIIMTDAAQKFVTPLTFSTLTNNQVNTDIFKEYVSKPGHISLADKADLLVIAPATANTIAKMSCGIADNLLTSTYLATRAPILIAPAMNDNMYSHPATQNNIETLKKLGIITIGPNEGMLACGRSGKGRMSEAKEIFDKISSMLTQER